MTLTNVFRRKCTIYTKSTSFDENNKINLYLCKVFAVVVMEQEKDYLRGRWKTENVTTATHNEVGVWGEEQAARYLQQKGYTIIEHDWKSGHKDIDLIALDGETVVFVEVKTRRNRVFGEPEDAVNYAKMKNLRAAFNHYIKYKCIDKNTRFDIVSVIGTPDGGLTDITHFEDVPIY